MAETRYLVVKLSNGEEEEHHVPSHHALAEACYEILKSRLGNKNYKYKPSRMRMTYQELEFVEWYDLEKEHLPSLIGTEAHKLNEKIMAQTSIQDEEKEWFESLKKLLAMSKENILKYQVPYSGRMVPTTYYLLVRRAKLYKNESVYLKYK